MAIEEHIKVLCKGVEAWNSWRASTPIERDLSNITLRWTRLIGQVVK